MIELFDTFPELKEHLPYVSFADLPTPVEKLSNLGKKIGVDELYIKRDDITAPLYGGNKIRKLEFLFGEALQQQARSVLTYGAAGSNHAIATAVHAKGLGLTTAVVMINQFNANYVRKNLLMHLWCGTDLYLTDDVRKIGQEGEKVSNCYKEKRNSRPYMIPVGGTSALGTCGFVNAAFELKKQVEEGILPEPDLLYVGFGSNGSAAGLILGLKAAGMKTKVVPVCVVDRKWSNASTLAKYVNETSDLLNKCSLEFPHIQLSESEIHVDHDSFGRAYSLFTKEGMEAIELIRKTEDIHLDGTYTGKALASLIRDASAGWLDDKKVMFWNTLNSRDLSQYTSNQDYKHLPEEFHKYFISNVQELER